MNNDSRSDSPEPPGDWRSPHPWDDVPLTQWNDWRWQPSHCLKSVEDFAQAIDLTLEEIDGLSTTSFFASM